MTSIVVVLLCTLNLIDYWQTMLAVEQYGLSVEANPIARFLFANNLEWIKLILVPMAVMAILLVSRHEKKAKWVLYILLILYFYVVGHNFEALKQLGII